MKLKIIWFLFYLFIFALLLNNSYSYLDPDLGWHLKVGQQIIQDKAVPSLEHYDFTLVGKSWVDHEWLANVVSFLVYDHAGYPGLNILFALIALTVLIILNSWILKNIDPKLAKDFRVGLIIIALQIIGVEASLPHLGVRMQEITLLNLLLVLIILYRYDKNSPKYKILFWLLPLFYFWACLHAGFLIGLLVLFFWSGIKIIKHLTQKPEPLFNPIIFVFLSFLATLFTPYGFKLYEFLFGYSNTFYLTHIAEWLPFYYFPVQYWQLFFNAIVAAVVLLLIAERKKLQFKNNLFNIGLALIFLILALKSRRHFPLLLIVSFPLLIDFFIYFFDFKNSQTTGIFKNQAAYKIINFFLISYLLASIAFQIVSTDFCSNPFLKFNDSYPRDAVLFLKNHPQYLGKKTLAAYSWGGYLIWNLPENKLFIDGRLPQYEFANHTLMEEYYEFFKKDKSEEKLGQYGVELVLLDIKQNEIKFNWLEKRLALFNEAAINKRENDLRDYLSNSNKWVMIYSDGVSAVYAKKNI
jgi:hypothetical protein